VLSCSSFIGAVFCLFLGQKIHCYGTWTDIDLQSAPLSWVVKKNKNEEEYVCFYVLKVFLERINFFYFKLIFFWYF
jgi:hypothetical protein